MSRATFFGLEIGRTGMAVSQIGLDVTGHNIANVDTLGYTRQRIIQTAYDPNPIYSKIKPLQQALVGGGTLVRVHDQIRSAFLDRQYRTEVALFSYWNTRSQGLSFVQSVFEDSEAQLALSDNIKKLFQSFLAETSDTDNKDPRDIIRESAKTMILQFQTMYRELTDLQIEQDEVYTTQVDQINTMADNISALNDAIYRFELLSNEYANDLRDKRNLLLDQLSEIVPITYSTSSDGQLTVKIAGHDLVNHLEVNKLELRTEANVIAGEDDVHIACWSDTPGLDLDLDSLTGGTLKATRDLRDGNTSTSSEVPGIPYFIEQLNNLARAMVQEVNTQHSKGWTYPTNGFPSVTCIDFFKCDDYTYSTIQRVDENGDPVFDINGIPIYDKVYDVSNITAKNLSLSDEVLENAFYIATSGTEVDINTANPDPNYLKEGHNENIKAIANLINTKDITITFDTGSGPQTVTIGSLEGFLRGGGIELFSTRNQSDKNADNRQIQLIDVDNQRQAVSGVSLDEEMTSIMKYTHAFNGAARVITAMDEAIDVIVNRMGRVGL